MRSLLLVLTLAAIASAQPLKKPVALPKLPPAEQAPLGSLSPAGQLRAAALDQSTRVAEINQPFTQYLSLYDCPDKDLPTRTVLLRYLLNTVSQGSEIIRPEVVPETGGRLLRVDIRKGRWTRDAWSTVARRDPYFREPMVPHRETEFLRRTIGVKQDPKTFSAEIIVNAQFLMRDLLQVDGRSETYYDLLYAEQRFGKGGAVAVVPSAAIPPDPGPEPQEPKGVPWKGGVWHDGKSYPAGSFSEIPTGATAKYQTELAVWKLLKEKRDQALAAVPKSKEPGALKKNFPATLKEWEEFWGVEGAERFAKDRGFLIQNGEIAAGSRNTRGGKGGSYVAFNDRVIVVTPVPTGYHLETYDSTETKNEKDYLENPLNVVDGKIVSDAGELLVHLPNGLQAALLVNGKGDRVEVADSRVARNTADVKDVTVRTQIGCIQCHGPEGGFISPTNRKLRDSIEAGLKLKTLKEEDRDRITAFFLDWEEKEAAIRAKMQSALRKITAAKAVDAKDKGWSGAELVAVMMEFRDWYDEPVTLDEAALHLGEAKPLVFKALTGSPTAGLNLVAVNKGMPRNAWDTTGALEAGQLLMLLRVPFLGAKE